MGSINAWAVLVSGVAGAIVTTVWYIAFRGVHAQLQPQGSGQIVDYRAAPVAAKVIDFLRGFVVAVVLAYLVNAIGVTTWGGSMKLAVILWVGFPVVLLIAPVIWGGQPWKLAVLHSGDWLVKLTVMTVIIGVWH
jgi:Protein of unknown function (DUF1761)